MDELQKYELICNLRITNSVSSEEAKEDEALEWEANQSNIDSE